VFLPNTYVFTVAGPGRDDIVQLLPGAADVLEEVGGVAHPEGFAQERDDVPDVHVQEIRVFGSTPWSDG
jgi:hypothetical protein